MTRNPREDPREDPLWQRCMAWDQFDKTFDDLANLDGYKAWLMCGGQRAEKKAKKEFPGTHYRVVMSKEMFEKLSEWREFCSDQAYKSPKGVGLGSAACIAIDVAYFIRANGKQPTVQEFDEMIKRYPKHGRPKQAYTKYGGPPRVQVRKEYTQ